MPMYGDPKSMVDKNADPQQKIAMLTEKVTELLEENNRLLSAQGGDMKKSTQALEKVYQDRIMSQT